MDPTYDAELNLTPSQRIEKLLRQLYSTRTSAGRQNIVEKMMPIFQRNPYLISHSKYAAGHWRSLRTPFQHFLMARVEDVEAIKMLGNNTKRVAEILVAPLGCGLLPIQMACQQSSAEVVDYLMSISQPELLALNNNYIKCSFELAMKNRKLPIATLTRLLELDPIILSRENILSKAMTIRGMPSEFLESLVKAWPDTTTYLNFKYLKEPLDMTRTKVLCKLFPKLTTLYLETRGWDVEAFGFLLKKLVSTQSIAKIENLTLPSLTREATTEQQQEILGDFQLLLETNSTMKSLSCNVHGGEDVSMIQSWLQVIDRGIRNNKMLYFYFRVEAWTCSVCVRTGRLPVKIGDNNTNINQGHRSGLCLDISSAGDFDEDEPDFLASLLPQISTYSSFRVVQLRQATIDAPKDITNEIVALLDQNHAFKRLLCEGYKVNLVDVCEALRKNSRLLSFGYSDVIRGIEVSSDALLAGRSLLQEDNATLVEFNPLGAACPKIRHYLDLNRLGRSIARTIPSHQGEKLVQLLLNVREDEGLQNELHDISTTIARRGRQDLPTGAQAQSRANSVVFGLLSEAPGSWCYAAAVGRKRKRPPPDRLTSSLQVSASHKLPLSPTTPSFQGPEEI